MSLLELLFPQLSEIVIPIIIILLGIAITFGLGWIPFIGSKFVMLGIGIISIGTLYWVFSVNQRRLLESIPENIKLIGSLIFILLISMIILWGKKKK